MREDCVGAQKWSSCSLSCRTLGVAIIGLRCTEFLGMHVLVRMCLGSHDTGYDAGFCLLALSECCVIFNCWRFASWRHVTPATHKE
jgi:hypothetical protein